MKNIKFSQCGKLKVFLRSLAFDGMKALASLLFLFSITVSYAESGQITFNTGVVMEYNEVKVEGETAILKIEGGEAKIKKSQLCERDQEKFFGPLEKTANKDPVVILAPKVLDKKAPDTVAPSEHRPSSVKDATPLPVSSSDAALQVSPAVEDDLWPEGEAFSLYPEFRNIPESDLPATDVKPKVKTGEYKIKIEGAEDMEVSVFYRIPMNGDKPAASANNLVFYCPYPTEKNKITGSHQLMITDIMGCSMFTFCFDAKEDVFLDNKRLYWSTQSGWLRATMETREKICREFGLDKRKLILMGESAGSNMAEALAVTYPEEVEAAAMIGGQMYLPLPKSSPVKWLVTNTRGDSTTTANKALAAGLRKIGAFVIFATPAPEHKFRDLDLYNHIPGPQSRELVNGFIWGILKDREALINGTIPRIWPYAVSIFPKDKFKIEANRNLSPTVEQLLLPSAAFAEAWSRVAPKIQKVSLPDTTGVASKVFLGFPGRMVPKGVVVYYDTLSYLNYGTTVENISTLAEMGYAVIAPADFGSKSVTPDRFLKIAMSWIGSQRTLSNSPLHLCGIGKPSLAFLNAASLDSSVNPASFGILQLEAADMQPDYKRVLATFAKKCPFVIAFRVEKKEDEEAQRLADSIFTKTSERRGSKKVELGAKDKPVKTLGAGLLAFSEVMEKAARISP